MHNGDKWSFNSVKKSSHIFFDIKKVFYSIDIRYLKNYYFIHENVTTTIYKKKKNIPAPKFLTILILY